MSNTALAEVGQELTKSKAEISRNGNRVNVKVISLPSPMFVNCLLEPAGWQSRQRRWTAMLSFIMQLIGLAVLALIPLMFTDILPPQQLVTFLVAPPPPPPPPPPPTIAAAPAKTIIGEIVSGRLIAPTKIPDQIKMIREDEAPPTPANLGVVGGVPGGVAGGQLGGVLGGIISSGAARSVVAPVLSPPKRMRVSEGVSAGQLINRVQPDYPRIARDARIQGTVELTAWITKDGNIERLTVLRGHPMLINAAVEAVRQWRWRPFKLNGEPIEVETNVTVVFSMSNGGS
jgi:periplasmic protein TonB